MVKEQGDIFNDWKSEHHSWVHNNEGKLKCKIDYKNIDNLDKLCNWLYDSKNWFNSNLDIVKINGSIPSISKFHVWKIAPNSPYKKEILEVIFTMMQNKRNGKLDEE